MQPVCAQHAPTTGKGKEAHLHALRARVDLKLDVVRDLVGQVAEQGVQHIGRIVAHGLDGLVPVRQTEGGRGG